MSGIKTFEHLCFRCISQGAFIILAATYRPGSEPPSPAFLRNLHHTLSSLRHSWLMGNIHIHLAIGVDPDARKLQILIESFDIVQCVETNSAWQSTWPHHYRWYQQTTEHNRDRRPIIRSHADHVVCMPDSTAPIYKTKTSRLWKNLIFETFCTWLLDMMLCKTDYSNDIITNVDTLANRYDNISTGI